VRRGESVRRLRRSSSYPAPPALADQAAWSDLLLESVASSLTSVLVSTDQQDE
jgi:hypothetical protein